MTANDGVLHREYRFTTLPEHLILDTEISDRAMRLWCRLDRYAGANGEAFPTRETLAVDLGCSRASVDRALAELVTGGWLRKERRYAGGPNDYTLLIAKKPQVSAARRLTGDDTLDSRVMTPPALTGDDTPSSPVTQPVVTGAAQKEASVKETELSDGDGSADAQPALDGTPTPPAEDKPLHVQIAEGWWEWYVAHVGPIVRGAGTFVVLRDQIVRPALEAGYTEREVKFALRGPERFTPDAVPSKSAFQKRLAEVRDHLGTANQGRQIDNRHTDTANRQRIVDAFNNG